MKNFLFIYAFIFCFALLISCSEHKNDDDCCQVGIDPIKNVFLMENHNQAFIVYKKLNVKNRTLLHFDAHIDLNWIPSNELKLVSSNSNPDSLSSFLKFPYEYYIPGKKFLHVGNWIYPLLKDNSIGKFYWVVPDEEILTQRWLGMFRKGLKLYQKHITDSEINSFTINTKLKRVEGTLYGKPIYICSMVNIPRFKNPVILDIDTDYFDFNSTLFLERLTNPLFWPGDFINRLKQKQLKADIVTICYSLEDGYNTLSLRFMGQDLERCIKAGYGLSAEAKQLMELHRQLYRAAFDKTSVDINSTMALLKTKYPGDAPSFYLLSRKFAVEGNRRASLENLKIAAHLDKQYKFAALHRANNLFYDKEYSRALQLYDRIVGQNLLTNNFIFRRIANCNRILGRLDRAEKIYRVLIQKEPDNMELYSGLQEVLLRTERGKMLRLDSNGFRTSALKK